MVVRPHGFRTGCGSLQGAALTVVLIMLLMATVVALLMATVAALVRGRVISILMMGTLTATAAMDRTLPSLWSRDRGLG
jgi:hypothetical protein